VKVGGITVALGDWVVGDIDGVTIVPGSSLDDVVAAGRSREAKEAAYFAALKAGETTVGLLDLDALLITVAEPT
jgi:regulator of RNase E activity RraA